MPERLVTERRPVPYHDSLSAYRRLRSAPSFLLESLHEADQNARLSLAGVQPCLRLRGWNDRCEVTRLAERGQAYLDALRGAFVDNLTEDTPGHLLLQFPLEAFSGPEVERFERAVPGAVPRYLLGQFHQEERNFLGLYGAFGYHFVFEYEDLRRELPADSPDFDLFLYDNLLLFNHLTEEGLLYVTRETAAAAQSAADDLNATLEVAEEQPDNQGFSVHNLRITPDEETYKARVEQARELCRRGDLMEIVLARKVSAETEGDPLRLYEAYRELNPAPYLFFFEFGEEEYLLGASPEMMLRVEHGRAVVRPISGSAPRGANPIEDHAHMLELLNSPKEKAELDMLIDLARNDLARVCEPGVALEQYRKVEKYARVMHTVSQVHGQLPEETPAFDALVACLNAGTLTGAPKPAAMRHIEALEDSPRGYYGGAVGYLHTNNELNTGIIIRSAHIRQGRLSYHSGATLLYESDPAAELAETGFKAAAFLEVLQPFTTHGESLADVPAHSAD